MNKWKIAVKTNTKIKDIKKVKDNKKLMDEIIRKEYKEK